MRLIPDTKTTTPLPIFGLRCWFFHPLYTPSSDFIFTVLPPSTLKFIHQVRYNTHTLIYIKYIVLSLKSVLHLNRLTHFSPTWVSHLSHPPGLPHTGSLFEEYCALADYEAEDGSQVSFQSGDKVLVMSKDESGTCSFHSKILVRFQEASNHMNRTKWNYTNCTEIAGFEVSQFHWKFGNSRNFYSAWHVHCTYYAKRAYFVHKLGITPGWFITQKTHLQEIVCKPARHRVFLSACRLVDVWDQWKIRMGPALLPEEVCHQGPW